MKIIIGADIVPTESNKDLFIIGDSETLIGTKLTELLSDSDCRIFNLEVPLTDTETPIKKNGPNLIASCKTIKGIKNIGVDLFTLANNHIMDQGVEGFNSTLKVLRENHITYVGAGSNINNASKPYIIEKGGVKVGVYVCAEHEFSIADENTCGANPFDPLYSYDHVAELKKECDHVIVLYHGGKEHYRYPSPDLQKYCRRFIDKGADVVVCQHSHCIGCEEKYQKGTIVYGQGNFLFDNGSDSEFWRTSLLIQIDDNYEISYIPLMKVGNKVRMAEDKEAKEILNQFYERSKKIQESGFIQNKYDEFASSMMTNYINSLFGDNIIFRIINKLCGYRLRAKLSEGKRLRLINFINCEAHRELMIRGFELNDEK